MSLERLGQTDGFGQARRTLRGDGVLLIATGHETSVGAGVDTFAAAAGPLFERVMALRRWRHVA